MSAFNRQEAEAAVGGLGETCSILRIPRAIACRASAAQVCIQQIPRQIARNEIGRHQASHVARRAARTASVVRLLLDTR